MTIRNALLGGRSAGLATALGVATGLAIWALATSAGLVALLIASEPLFLAVNMSARPISCGSACNRCAPPSAPATLQQAIAQLPARGLRPRQAYVQGVVSDLSNPKIAAFFFVDAAAVRSRGRDGFRQPRGAGPVVQRHDARVADGLRAGNRAHADALRRPRVRRTLDGITGVTLIGLGVKLASEDR